ncbi:hypothetical protein [Helicobacter trogontum]|uniref:Uncharacterized protein n=1 Tax=Helicobacter trogontum TaxID=50960 RepID=A0A4U8SAT3_9HELI|nr:hypothetical protein [Helicobacter trogontum]TLD83144.1 hypothetical protein LS81_005610 [Helicobacter trogontum]
MIDTKNTSLNNNLGLYNASTHYIKREVSTQNNIAAKQNEEQLLDSNGSETKRQTYGLAILELMSDQEYQAWLRATAGMTETEKMLAVQKLYPLADLEKLKNSKNLHSQERTILDDSMQDRSSNISAEPFIINANRLNGMRVFNAHTDFIQRYKNAFENLHLNVDMNG